MYNQINSQSQPRKDTWQHHLDLFVRANQQQLAALAWVTYLEQQDSQAPDTLGIDLKPTPHFVFCSQEALEALNRQVNGLLQEILGIVYGYKPEQEVAIIAIGDSQIKLINFAPEPTPPECFEQIAEDKQTLMSKLEESLGEHFSSFDNQPIDS